MRACIALWVLSSIASPGLTVEEAKEKLAEVIVTKVLRRADDELEVKLVTAGEDFHFVVPVAWKNLERSLREEAGTRGWRAGDRVNVRIEPRGWTIRVEDKTPPVRPAPRVVMVQRMEYARLTNDEQERAKTEGYRAGDVVLKALVTDGRLVIIRRSELGGAPVPVLIHIETDTAGRTRALGVAPFADLAPRDKERALELGYQYGDQVGIEWDSATGAAALVAPAVLQRGKADGR